jgi:hypothetical protein
VFRIRHLGLVRENGIMQCEVQHSVVINQIRNNAPPYFNPELSIQASDGLFNRRPLPRSATAIQA